MANLTEISSYDAGVYRIETTDSVVGGETGISNLQAKALANRTKWLNDRMQRRDSFNVTSSAPGAAPPGSPSLTVAYLIPSGATGAWATQDGKIGFYNGASWSFELDPLAQHRAESDPHPQYITQPELDAAGANYAPPGSVMMFARTAAPTGWLKCNGALISRTTYATLWSVAQASGMIAASDAAWTGGEFGKFSPGDGTTSFRLPDARGEFLRAFDDARGVDIGRTLGSRQADEIKSHDHESNTYTGPGALNVAATPGSFVGARTGATGGAETRPRNVALLACIKY
jgi:microcystin-dependent protein